MFNVNFGFVAYRDHPPEESSYVIKSIGLTDMIHTLSFIKSLNAKGNINLVILSKIKI